MESDVSGAGVSGPAEVTLGAGTLAATGVADLPIELAGGAIGGSLASAFDCAELVAALELAGGSPLTLDRKTVVYAQRVEVRVRLGGSRIIPNIEIEIKTI